MEQLVVTIISENGADGAFSSTIRIFPIVFTWHGFPCFSICFSSQSNICRREVLDLSNLLYVIIFYQHLDIYRITASHSCKLAKC